MSRPPSYAKRVDANQAEIVAALRSEGAVVWIIGLPVDLLVGAGGKTALVEVKTLTGVKAPKAAGYTDLQNEFFRTWTGGTVCTLTDAEGARAMVRMLRS